MSGIPGYSREFRSRATKGVIRGRRPGREAGTVRRAGDDRDAGGGGRLLRDRPPAPGRAAGPDPVQRHAGRGDRRRRRHDHPAAPGLAHGERGRPRDLRRPLRHPQRLPEQALPVRDGGPVQGRARRARAGVRGRFRHRQGGRDRGAGEGSRTEDPLFEQLRALVYYGYYSRPVVTLAINRNLPAGRDYHGPPLPYGYLQTTEPWDEDLLDAGAGERLVPRDRGRRPRRPVPAVLDEREEHTMASIRGDRRPDHRLGARRRRDRAQGGEGRRERGVPGAGSVGQADRPPALPRRMGAREAARMGLRPQRAPAAGGLSGHRHHDALPHEQRRRLHDPLRGPLAALQAGRLPQGHRARPRGHDRLADLLRGPRPVLRRERRDLRHLRPHRRPVLPGPQAGRPRPRGPARQARA